MVSSLRVSLPTCDEPACTHRPPSLPAPPRFPFTPLPVAASWAGGWTKGPRPEGSSGHAVSEARKPVTVNSTGGRADGGQGLSVNCHFWSHRDGRHASSVHHVHDLTLRTLFTAKDTRCGLPGQTSPSTRALRAWVHRSPTVTTSTPPTAHTAPSHPATRRTVTPFARVRRQLAEARTRLPGLSPAPACLSSAAPDAAPDTGAPLSAAPRPRCSRRRARRGCEVTCDILSTERGGNTEQPVSGV